MNALEQEAMIDNNYIHNGRGYGELGEYMASRNIGFDPGRMRPYLDDKTGRPCVTINTGKVKRDDKSPTGVSPIYKQVEIDALRQHGIYIPTGNALTTRKLDYVKVQTDLVEVSRKPQVAAADLAAIDTIGGFDGMAKETYEYEAVSDYGEAIEDMDGLSAGRNDHPLVALSSTPLPITHVNLSRSARRMAVWDNSSPGLRGLDTKNSGLRLGERLEQNVIGTVTGKTFGTVSTGPTAQRVLTGAGNTIASKVYGYTTHPARYTKTNLTTPTTSNSNTTFTEVLAMRQTLLDANFNGEYVLYHSSEWDQFMDNMYGIYTGSAYGFTPSKTLRQMLRGIEGISDVKRLAWLTASTNPYNLLLVFKDSRYFSMLNGMDLQTVQYPTKGGMMMNWITMWIKLPLFKFDHNGYLPVVHATTS